MPSPEGPKPGYGLSAQTTRTEGLVVALVLFVIIGLFMRLFFVVDEKRASSDAEADYLSVA